MIGVIDYKAGNAPSVYNAFQKLGHEVKMVSSPGDFTDVSGLVLPGVGSAGATMRSLREMDLIGILERKVLKDGIPFLGICIGMQILFEFSEEGDVPCLGWLKGRVERFDNTKVRVPQMGWNEVVFRKDHPLVEGLGASGHFYYVNSYHAVPENPEDILAVTDYNGEFCCMVQHDNIFAAQFHAEKSGPLGLKIMDNFTKIAEGGRSC